MRRGGERPMTSVGVAGLMARASGRGRATNASSAPLKPDAQESFTDSDSRVMKRAGGGFDYS